jgi:hypothetical protein
MAAETAEPQSDDLLIDLDILEPVGGLDDSDGDAEDLDDDTAATDGDSMSDEVVYVEVDEDEVVAIDGDVEDSDVGDDSSDDSFDDGYGLDDMSIGDGADLSPSDGFEDVDDE